MKTIFNKISVKVISLLLFICLILSVNAFPSQIRMFEAEEHVVLSFNIKADTKTGSNHKEVFEVVKNYDPDLIAFNEVNCHTGPHLIKLLTDAGYSYFGTSDWKPGSNEDVIAKAAWSNYVFYKAAKYKVLDSGTFSISDNPDDPHAFISNMDMIVKNYKEGRPRNCNWIYIKSLETNDRFVFSSAHVQHGKSDYINYNEIGLTILGEQLKVLGDKYHCDVICGGDMNADFDKMTPVTSQGYNVANQGEITFGNRGSIDNIFYSDGFNGWDFEVGTHYDISDHKPIRLTIGRNVSYD